MAGALLNRIVQENAREIALAVRVTMSTEPSNRYSIDETSYRCIYCAYDGFY